ncbi:MAG: hypothetical protein Q8L23_07020 [Caulobacter sp.]|nr:hypothetical protein [Caulobacter sp.]
MARAQRPLVAAMTAKPVAATLAHAIAAATLTVGAPALAVEPPSADACAIVSEALDYVRSGRGLHFNFGVVSERTRPHGRSVPAEFRMRGRGERLDLRACPGVVASFGREGLTLGGGKAGGRRYWLSDPVIDPKAGKAHVVFWDAEPDGAGIAMTFVRAPSGAWKIEGGVGVWVSTG